MFDAFNPEDPVNKTTDEEFNCIVLECLLRTCYRLFHGKEPKPYYYGAQNAPAE